MRACLSCCYLRTAFHACVCTVLLCVLGRHWPPPLGMTAAAECECVSVLCFCLCWLGSWQALLPGLSIPVSHVCRVATIYILMLCLMCVSCLYVCLSAEPGLACADWAVCCTFLPRVTTLCVVCIKQDCWLSSDVIVSTAGQFGCVFAAGQCALSLCCRCCWSACLGCWQSPLRVGV